jgi:3-hydroxyisobutyrate dehydrogenase-like beta-hydroxyacid dehydrogenase
MKCATPNNDAELRTVAKDNAPGSAFGKIGDQIGSPHLFQPISRPFHPFPQENNVNIGFLGLGNMGEPIAANLLAAGHAVTVWNRTAAKAERLVQKGAKLAESIGDASAHQIVMTMVADDHALGEILQNGLLEALPAGALHVSLSTISVAMSEHLKKAHGERKQLYVSAPVFGRPEAAAAKKLFIVAAGESEALKKAKPLLEAIGQQTVELGDDPVRANVVKISGNFLIASAMEAMGEAVALVRKYDVDPVQYMEFMTSTLFAAPVYKNYGMKIAKAEYEPVGFRAPLGLKDVRLALAAGESKGTPLPLASLLRDHMLMTISHYGPEVDWSMIAKLAADHAGLK